MNFQLSLDPVSLVLVNANYEVTVIDTKDHNIDIPNKACYLIIRYKINDIEFVDIMPMNYEAIDLTRSNTKQLLSTFKNKKTKNYISLIQSRETV